MKNPNKYIRQAYMAALAGIDVPVYDMKVPKSVIPHPEPYILLSAQTKTQNSMGRGCHAEDCTITLDIISVQALGYGSRAVLDDTEEQVHNAISAGISVAGFSVISTRREDSYDASLDTDAQSVYRRILRYRHVLEETPIEAI